MSNNVFCQHYELPPEFFFPIMGKHLKYSCCLFLRGIGDDDLDAAEFAALKQVEERAELEDGQEILELGCGQTCCVLCCPTLTFAYTSSWGWSRLGLSFSLDGRAIPQVSNHVCF